MAEIDLIKERYAIRNFNKRYSFVNPDIYLKFQERERKLVELLKRNVKSELNNLKVLEIGFGTGDNLVELILLGFSANNLFGIELLEERLNEARKRLPPAVNLILGDALSENNLNYQFDLVYQSTVFSSILDDQFQEDLAKKMLQWTKPDGAILWYDFIFNNPQNRDVRGVSFTRIKELFPQCKIVKSKITLAPPIARKIVRIHPKLYTVFNLFPPLKTHLICWIKRE